MRLTTASNSDGRGGGPAVRIPVALFFAACLAHPVVAQQHEAPDSRPELSGTRWVGIVSDVPTIGMWLEFFSDSMMLLETGNAQVSTHPLDYRATQDSIIGWGDTTVVASYEFVHGRLLLYTADGAVITMAEQAPLARSFVGLWTGSLETATGDLIPTRLRINPNGTASWRHQRGGETHVGEWDRSVRTFTFTWAPDSIQWIGYHDPEGDALQFVSTGEGTAGSVFRKAYR